MSPSFQTAARLCAAALLIGLAAAPARADVVSVKFTVAADEMATWLGNRRSEIERQVSDGLIAYLDRTFPFWTYQVADPAAAAPSLVAELRHTATEWKLIVTLTTRQDQRLTLEPVWRSNAEMVRLTMPAPADLPPQMLRAIEPALESNRDAVFAKLQHVPLGRDAQLQAGSEPTAVLALGWERHRPLALSSFSLVYQTTQGVITLMGKGKGMTSAYLAPPPQAGLAVFLEKCEVSGADQALATQLPNLLTLRPLAVMLTRFDDRGFLLPAADPMSATPTIVPVGR